MRKTFVAQVTQILLPDGRTKPMEADLPKEVQADYESMIKHGCRIESEILTTGVVSTTITHEDEDVDIDLAPNDGKGKVLEGLVAMLKRRKWLILPNPEGSGE